MIAQGLLTMPMGVARENSHDAPRPELQAMRRGNAIQLLMALVTAFCGLIACNAWNNELYKRKFELTAKLIEGLYSKEYISALWALQEFTVCFENEHNKSVSPEKAVRLSYVSFDEIDVISTEYSAPMFKKWWDLVETTEERHACKEMVLDKYKLFDLEFELYQIYAKFSQMQSCINNNYCDESLMGKLSIEALDGISPMAFMSYLANASKYSREWDLYRGSASVTFIVKLSDANWEYVRDSRKKIWLESECALDRWKKFVEARKNDVDSQSTASTQRNEQIQSMQSNQPAKPN